MFEIAIPRFVLYDRLVGKNQEMFVICYSYRIFFLAFIGFCTFDFCIQLLFRSFFGEKEFIMAGYESRRVSGIFKMYGWRREINHWRCFA
jgi:hypothetical protein